MGTTGCCAFCSGLLFPQCILQRDFQRKKKMENIDVIGYVIVGLVSVLMTTIVLVFIEIWKFQRDYKTFSKRFRLRS